MEKLIEIKILEQNNIFFKMEFLEMKILRNVKNSRISTGREAREWNSVRREKGELKVSKNILRKRIIKYEKKTEILANIIKMRYP